MQRLHKGISRRYSNEHSDAVNFDFNFDVHMAHGQEHIRPPHSHPCHLSIVPQWHQSLYAGTEENGMKRLKPEGDSLLHISVCRTSLASHVFLNLQLLCVLCTGHVHPYPSATTFYIFS